MSIDVLIMLLFTFRKNFLFGIVIAPMSWCRGEWVEYTLVACLTVCLTRILNYENKIITQKKLIDNKATKLTGKYAI